MRVAFVCAVLVAVVGLRAVHPETQKPFTFESGDAQVDRLDATSSTGDTTGGAGIGGRLASPPNLVVGNLLFVEVGDSLLSMDNPSIFDADGVMRDLDADCFRAPVASLGSRIFTPVGDSDNDSLWRTPLSDETEDTLFLDIRDLLAASPLGEADLLSSVTAADLELASNFFYDDSAPVDHGVTPVSDLADSLCWDQTMWIRSRCGGAQPPSE